jgi:hypothetical protein
VGKVLRIDKHQSCSSGDSITSQEFSRDGRIHVPVTVLCRSRSEIEDQKRSSEYDVSPIGLPYGKSTDKRPRKRAGPRPEEFQNIPRSPDRSTMPQMHNPAFGGYPTTGREYSTYYGGPVKRPRTSVDLGTTRGLYDNDGRFTQAYPQATLYTNQGAGGYQNPMFPGYSTGQTGLPDYAVRQPQSVSNPGSSYSASEDPMLAMRPLGGAGYMTSQRYPAYTGAQMSYGIPSAQIPQLADSQRNPQANLQPLVTGQTVNQQTTV